MLGWLRHGGFAQIFGGKAVLNRHGAVLPPEQAYQRSLYGEGALNGGGALSRTNISTSGLLVTLKSLKILRRPIPRRYRIAVSF